MMKSPPRSRGHKSCLRLMTGKSSFRRPELPDMRKAGVGEGEPLISIIIPIFNKADVLQETLDSAL